MTLTPYPTLRLKLTMPQALKLRFLPAIPGTNAANAAAEAVAAAAAATAAADAAVAATTGKVDKAGDTMTGALTLSADPIANLHAATKQYVDGTIGGSGDVNTDGAVVATQLAGFADATGTLIRGVTVGSGLDMSAGTTLNLDDDLSALAAVTDVDAIFYRSSAGVWDPVVIGDNLTFAAGELSATGGGSGGAPVTVEYITASTSTTLTAERVLTDTTTVTWDFATAGQAKANVAGGTAAPDSAEYITAATNATLSAERVLTNTASVVWDFATAGQAKASTTVGAPQGRLTLSTATPVLTTTVSGATTIYYTPYAGNKVPIYDGTSMAMTTFAELTNVTSNSAVGSAGPAVVAANSNYDLFVWSNAGTVMLTRGPLWISATGRGTGAGTTELTRVNGILLNAVSITNGPAASRGTYVGTVRSNGSSQIDWILGGNAAGGTAGFFGVWNAYNRVLTTSRTGNTNNSWSLTTVETWREVNGSTSMRCSIVRGLNEDAVLAQYTCSFDSGVINGSIGIGLDTTTNFNGTTGNNTSGATNFPSATATYNDLPGLGFHYLQAVELSSTAAGVTFLGDGAVTYIQGGMSALFMA